MSPFSDSYLMPKITIAPSRFPKRISHLSVDALAVLSTLDTSRYTSASQVSGRVSIALCPTRHRVSRRLFVSKLSSFPKKKKTTCLQLFGNPEMILFSSSLRVSFRSMMTNRFSPLSPQSIEEVNRFDDSRQRRICIPGDFQHPSSSSSSSSSSSFLTLRASSTPLNKPLQTPTPPKI